MEQYLGHILTTLVMLGGLAGVHARVMARLTKIETRLEMDDAGKEDRKSLRAAETYKIVDDRLRRHMDDCQDREPTGVRTVQ